MNYRHVYMCIIAHAKSEMKERKRPSKKSERKNFPNQYFEFHHIFPRSLFPQYEDFERNLVALTAREHFFCHELLTKIWPSRQMIYALSEFMFRKNDIRRDNLKITAKQYEIFRLEFSKYQSKVHKGYFERMSKDKKEKSIEKWRESNKRSPDELEKLRLKRAEIKSKKSAELKEKEYINRSLALKKIASLKTKEQRSKDYGQSKGTFWWNNGEINIRSKDCPGDNFKKGRLKFKKLI